MGGPERFCRKCGHELRQGAQFCTACGHTVSAGDQPTVTTNRPGDPAGKGDAAAYDSRATTTMPVPDQDTFIPADDQDTFIPADDQDTRPPRPGRSRWLLITGLAVLVVAVAATAVIVLAHPFSHPARASAAQAPGTPAPSPPVSSPPSGSPSPTPSTPSPSSQRQAANSLAGLLGQSVQDRNSVNSAFTDVTECGPDLTADTHTFQNAAASRQQLLSQLAAMPARSALSGQMLQDLTSAWKASVQADTDFAGWARDEASAGCKPNDQSDPHFVAAKAPDGRATAGKKAFLRLWNPLATRYQLTTYQQGSL